jgi:hypothetical protein
MAELRQAAAQLAKQLHSLVGEVVDDVRVCHAWWEGQASQPESGQAQ